MDESKEYTLGGARYKRRNNGIWCKKMEGNWIQAYYGSELEMAFQAGVNTSRDCTIPGCEGTAPTSYPVHVHRIRLSPG